MTRCWIRKPGAAEAAGPFTLEDLRGLSRAGLLPVDTLASLSAYEGFRPVSGWSELTEALATPGVSVLHGTGGLHLGERKAAAATTGPEALIPEEKTSSLKLGRVAFEDTNAADFSAPVDAVEMLKTNRAAEAEKVLKFPPWYRSPFFKNLVRTIPFLVVGGVMIYFGMKRIKAGDTMMAPFLVGFGALLIGGGGYYTWFVSPARWDMD